MFGFKKEDLLLRQNFALKQDGLSSVLSQK